MTLTLVHARLAPTVVRVVRVWSGGAQRVMGDERHSGLSTGQVTEEHADESETLGSVSAGAGAGARAADGARAGADTEVKRELGGYRATPGGLDS